MFLCGTGKYQDVVNKDDHEVIKIFVEDVLYQMHELRRGIGNTKRHYQKFVGSSTRAKCGLRYILITYWHLPIFRP